jgi:hypothetical protein
MNWEIQRHLFNSKKANALPVPRLFFMGYFESSASQERSENNRVNYNLAIKNSGQPIALGPGPAYRKEIASPLQGWDKCN